MYCLLTNQPVFDWNNFQNGRLLGLIGIMSTLLQGGYVRPTITKIGEVKMAHRGVMSCVVSLLLLSGIPFLAKVERTATIAIRLMYPAVAFLAFTSATVVNALTSAASLQCDDDFDDVPSGREGKPETHAELKKGRALGKLRSSGQLGRAIGPLLGKYLLR